MFPGLAWTALVSVERPSAQSRESAGTGASHLRLKRRHRHSTVSLTHDRHETPAPLHPVLDARRLRRSSVSHRAPGEVRSEEHTSELQSRLHLVCRLLLEKKTNEYQVTTTV